MSCNIGHLKIIADLPKKLNEASGNEITMQSHLIWMMNESGNKSILFGVDEKGNIIKEFKIDAKNNDWQYC